MDNIGGKIEVWKEGSVKGKRKVANIFILKDGMTRDVIYS